MRKMLCMLLCMVVLAGQLWAQTRTLTGRVTDASGNPVANASVVVKGTTTGTTTKDDGTYSITIPGTARILVISGVGFGEFEQRIGEGNTIDAVLKKSDSDLQEVVVVGYSNTTKEAFTGSAVVVSGDALTNKNTSNVSQALAGEVAGVRVINATGQPGAAATIRIRGLGSVNGNRSPLYVIDGVPFTGVLNSINMGDVESTTVLKDAAATSIYGARGANGVIIITTKNGRSQKPFIEADLKVGTNFSYLPRYDKITNPEEYIELSWRAMRNQGLATGAADPVAYANANLFGNAGIDVDYNMWNVANGADLIDPATGKVRAGVTRRFNPESWEDYAFQPSNRTEATVRLGGGTGKTNYYTSVGYLQDKGYSINSDFKRFSARMNINQEIRSWLTASMNIGYANTTTNQNGQGSSSNSIFWFVDNLPSIYPLFRKDANGDNIPDNIYGGNVFDYGEAGRKFGSLTNAIADATYDVDRTKRNELNGNGQIKVNFTKELSFETRLGVQYFNSVNTNRLNKFYGSAAGQKGAIYLSRTELTNLNFLKMLRYAKDFGDHNIEVLAAHEATDWKRNTSTAGNVNLVSNDNLELTNGVVSAGLAGGYMEDYTLESYFAQVNYDFNRTYYLSATVRRDGTSRFVKDKWGNFGSIGLGWIVSNEGFMDKQRVFDYLKLKASFGLMGDQDGVGFYPGYDFYTVSQLNGQPSLTPGDGQSPDLTWETSQMYQAGIEFRLGSYLTGSLDYYVKNTNDLIFRRQIGISNGFPSLRVNDGKLRNQGFEFDLTAHLLKKKDYYFDFGVNGEMFTNKILRMPLDPSNNNEEKIIDIQGAYGWGKDRSIFDFYVRDFAGVDPADGKSTWVVFYDDENSDGQYQQDEEVLNLEQYLAENPDKRGSLLKSTTKEYADATQYYVGKSAIPKVRGAFNLRGGYKGFDIAIQFLYSLGGYTYDGAYANLMANDLIGGNNWHKDIRQSWTTPGQVTNVPRISNEEDANVASLSSRFITKASFMSLNNIRIGYNLPSTMLSRLNVSEASFFVSGDNLYINSARRGLNPTISESGASNIYTYAPLSTITVGMRVKL
ncbi:SusC/RagA family TonB-linked outer membrane protein [Flavihumibacter sp. UBA7668]|uniref:SusC/RagA family TonB-linked outer membrane protein n=1 Tax=Flavihumibacter sp. UBA7668 TaxID=1946542 RepID=UPI0025B90809|nr:SusC/RagA family TonB-linked outer membrane protein [Flavihumibacter sp. UBA7668]